MKKALVLNAIHPKIGGVLVRGEKGTAKSTAVRALAALLPEVDVVAGCPFGCDPDRPDQACDDCRIRAAADPAAFAAARHRRPLPVIDLPVGATEDRVTGTLDLEAAIQRGERRFEPGLLAAANRGILYIDEVNLLNDHLVDVLLDAAALGRNYVEREGISFGHPADLLLVGTMNPEEGDLRPQLLDRFALTVEVAGLPDPAERAHVVRRRIAFERDPAGFLAEWEPAEAAERDRIVRARALLPDVDLSDPLLDLITRICAEFEVDGLRADIVMYKTAVALAAYAGRRDVTPDDVREAAELALPHRRRRQPFESPEIDREKLDDLMATHNPPDQPSNQPPPEDSDDSEPEGGSGPEEQVGPDQPFQVRAITGPKTDQRQTDRRGRRSRAESTRTGAYVGSTIPTGPIRDLALGPTLRAAAPHQASRRAGEGPLPPTPSPEGGWGDAGPRGGAGQPDVAREDGSGLARDDDRKGIGARDRGPFIAELSTEAGPLGNDGTPPHPTLSPGERGSGAIALPRDWEQDARAPTSPPPPSGEGGGGRGPSPALLLRPSDLREKVRERKVGNLILFVVDASGSMAAQRRMVAVKTAILSLLLDAYQKRDQVGFIAFRGRGADLLLPPTNSVDLAERLLRSLPTGGRTPLGHGLDLAAGTIERTRAADRQVAPLIIVVSDCRPNVPLREGADPVAEVAGLGDRLARLGARLILVDTEGGPVRIGFGPEISRMLDALYLPLADVAGDTIAAVVRGQLPVPTVRPTGAFSWPDAGGLGMTRPGTPL